LEFRGESQYIILKVYNEQLIDLLDVQSKILDIKMLDKDGQDLYVINLRIQDINSPEEFYDCFKTAQHNRAVAATQSNER